MTGCGGGATNKNGRGLGGLRLVSGGIQNKLWGIILTRSTMRCCWRHYYIVKGALCTTQKGTIPALCCGLRRCWGRRGRYVQKFFVF